MLLLSPAAAKEPAAMELVLRFITEGGKSWML
jgi:hypothetical protein